MADKDLGESLENMEEGIENLKNKEFRVLGIKVTFMTATAALSLVGAVIGSLYGGFLMYQKIEEAIAFVDQQQEYQELMAGYDDRMTIIETKLEEAVGYTNEIKNDLKGDIRRIEGVVDTVERTSKETTRDVQTDIRAFRTEMKTLDRELREDLKVQDKDVRDRMDQVEADLIEKLQEALDNPLNDMK
jgi:DNA-binding FrmR family transcriptional regulator